MELKKWSLVLLGLMVIVSCSNEKDSDAFGQFEAEEVVISAETNGRLTSYDIEEGDVLDDGMKIAVVDTTNLHLQKLELKASIESVRSNTDKLDAQKEVLQSQLETAQKDLNRIQGLKADHAATQQQLDSAEGQVNTLKKQIQSVDVDKRSVITELNQIEAKIAQINNQIEESTITNPIRGTVLNTFAEEYELVAPGKPIYSIANLEEMILRIYVSGAQLPEVQLGETVEVIFDENKTDNQTTQGHVSWIASKAEFTPRMIQTKEERVTQVYAVKVRVDNPDGTLKIGMPGEVKFTSDETKN